MGEADPDRQPCKKDGYTAVCMTTCHYRNMCNEQGRCKGSTGECICFPRWTGERCKTPEATEERTVTMDEVSGASRNAGLTGAATFLICLVIANLVRVN